MNIYNNKTKDPSFREYFSDEYSNLTATIFAYEAISNPPPMKSYQFSNKIGKTFLNDDEERDWCWKRNQTDLLTPE